MRSPDMSSLPACCTPTPEADLAERLYCAYNRGGDPTTAGLNFQGNPCPLWKDLPQNIRDKWEAVVAEIASAPFTETALTARLYCTCDPEGDRLDFGDPNCPAHRERP
jgi:hypothetical protein